MTTKAAAKETTGLVNVKAFDFSLVKKFADTSQVKPSSLKSYLKGIKRFAEFCADNNITAPTFEVMVAYRKYLGEKYKSPATCNLYISGLKKFMAFLQNEGYIAKNPTELIKGFSVSSEHHSKSALTADDVKKIFATIDTSTIVGKRNAALFALLVTCGLRCIEAVRANTNDFEPVGNVIRLHVQGKGRDDKNETVNLPTSVFNLIQQYLEARGEVPTDDQGTPLFTSLSRNGSFGKRITTTSISRLIKKILVSAGYNSDRLTAHSLRHTAATTAIKAGCPIREVQQMCRHKNVAVTQIYLHELEEIENSATRKAAAAFGF